MRSAAHTVFGDLAGALGLDRDGGEQPRGDQRLAEIVDLAAIVQLAALEPRDLRQVTTRQVRRMPWAIPRHLGGWHRWFSANASSAG